MSLYKNREDIEYNVHIEGDDGFVSMLFTSDCGKFGTDENFDIIVNIDKGDLEIWRNREIVDDAEIEDDNLQIALSDAIKIENSFGCVFYSLCG